ncbi:IS1182 family transposase [Methylicorpusculum oleiharenae]|uniref:IS1182 family transposase n=1 Tax=Methylicorpusculum oleiharenae TaxID=1338687 RepID=UPI001E4E396F|nr:IS1182 family transposase [Methylicorpusculum oleiharenae]MCD2453230.1 IS1182 family transposase [Methylicorpusculum oleiharenae]
MTIPFKSRPVEFHQYQLFPGNVFDLLPEDHECFLYGELFEQLDTTSIEQTYSRKGQHAYHPKLMVSILIYAYSRGVFSSRQIERRCREDLSFLFIAQNHCPNFRVLSDFRKDHAAFFQTCFKQTVQLALALKLASLGHISLDGSKFKANTSKHKAMSYQHLKEQERQLTDEIEALIAQAARCDQEEDQRYHEQTGYELPADLQFKQGRLSKIKAAKQALEAREAELNPDQPIDGKKQISFADTDARIMGKKGDFHYRYNGQISVDADQQIIVAQHLSLNANDQQEVEPALTALQDSTGRLPDQLSADNGYFSGNNLEAFAQQGVDAYLAPGKGETTPLSPLVTSERKLVKADFTYHEADDTYTCPGEQTLTVVRHSAEGQKIYQGHASVCAECPYFKRCCQSQKGEARTLSSDAQEPLRQQMREKMRQPAAKAVYRQRKVIVEPVFGQIKNSGFRGFSVRGKDKVAGEFSLVCATHNLKKMVKAMGTGLVRPNFGKWALNPAT